MWFQNEIGNGIIDQIYTQIKQFINFISERANDKYLTKRQHI